MRFMKNSSRLDVKMARNLALSSRGIRWSDASASTRSLKSSQLISRSIQISASGEDTSWLRIPSSPIDTIAGAAHIWKPSVVIESLDSGDRCLFFGNPTLRQRQVAKGCRLSLAGAQYPLQEICDGAALNAVGDARGKYQPGERCDGIGTRSGRIRD